MIGKTIFNHRILAKLGEALLLRSADSTAGICDG